MADNLGADPALVPAASNPQAVSTKGFDPGDFVTGTEAASHWPDEEHLLYWPSFPGVHICGANHEDNYFYTIADFPTDNDGAAQALWDAIRAECEVEPDAADFVVDLNYAEAGHVDDFWSNSQMLSRIAAIATEARRAGTGNTDPVHEGAGLKGIAQTEGNTGTTHKERDNG